jgi:hypothetical protein
MVRNVEMCCRLPRRTHLIRRVNQNGPDLVSAARKRWQTTAEARKYWSSARYVSPEV